MPRQPTLDEVRDHVGPRALRRTDWYEPDDPSVDADTIRARIAGFEVSAMLAEPLTSRCGCLYRSACDHVAALLVAWRADPGRFRQVRRLAIELPSEPRGLLELIDAEHPSLMAVEVDRWVERPLPRGHPLVHIRYRNLGDTLRRLAEDVDEGRIEARQAVRPLMAGIRRHIADDLRRRESIARAMLWRTTPPEEAALLPLYESAIAEVAESELQTPPGRAGSVAVEVDETLSFRTRLSAWRTTSLPIRTDMLELAPHADRSDIAMIVLDSLVGRHAPMVRKAVLGILETPVWTRSLAQLDSVLARVGPRQETAIGWRLEGAGHQITSATPVTLVPYKRKHGFRSKKLTIRSLTELESAADRAAFAAMKAGGGAPMVVEHLIGHPAVVDGDGQLLAVREGELSVRVREVDGFRVDIEVDGRPLPPEALARFSVHGGRTLIRRGGVALVCSVEAVVEGLVGVLDRFGATFPASAGAALSQRLHPLGTEVPVQFEGSLRGERGERDDRPVLRLVPLADGAIRVEVRVQPMPQGRLFAPGVGPDELARMAEGTRTYVLRDRAHEAHRVRLALAELPLPELLDWNATLDRPDDGLELIWALRQREDVQILWPSKRMSVKGEVGVSALRVELTRRRDWFGMEGSAGTGKTSVGLGALLEAVRDGRRFVALDDRGWLRITADLQAALSVASQLATDDATPRLPALAAGRAMLALERAGAAVELPTEIRDLEQRIRAADHLDNAAPDGLNAVLRPYQSEGLHWLRRLAAWAPGAVLADDMGLGKTLQALGLILDRGGRTLVVAPASVGLNWRREAVRFTPSIPVWNYRGPGRQESLDASSGIWVTSYELMVRDAPRLAEIRWDTVVFDEAQALKNPRTRRAAAARSLDTRFALALTGTPIENHLLELWSLLRVVAPGLLGPREHFLSRFGEPLMRGEPLAGGRLSSLLKPFLLRRTKTEVAPDLPPRLERTEWVELSGPERTVYERFRLAAVQAVEQGSGEPMQTLAALTRLRQVACDARLVDDDIDTTGAKITRATELVLEAVARGEQVLVFSQFTSLLDLADTAFATARLRRVRLDGRTSMRNRTIAVDAFQAGQAEVFLIALKAGGVGLNLTAATTVLLLDPWWNPASEDQAADRAHRIGQNQTVNIVRLVTAGTVEEQVLALHADKRALADRVLSGAGGASRLTADALVQLLLADQP